MARKGVEAGYRVFITASGDPDAIAMTIEIVAPGAEPRFTADVIPEADAVVFAVLFAKHESLPLGRLGGKLVIDAMDYWAPSDGELPEVTGSELGTSELVRAKLPPGTRVVNALNTVGYHELDLDGRPKGVPDRKVIAVAGDDREAVRAVSYLIDDLGFNPVDAGGLANGWALEPGTSVFGTGFDAKAIAEYLRGNVLGAARLPHAATVRKPACGAGGNVDADAPASACPGRLGTAFEIMDQLGGPRDYIGMTDAANVVIADHYRTTNLLTLDQRHLRKLRPLWGAEYFTLLPYDHQ